MGNFWLFQQARCEVIVKYTNCNLLEHEWIRTVIRTLDTQIDEKNKNIEARQNVTGSYVKMSVYFEDFIKNTIYFTHHLNSFVSFLWRYRIWAYL